MVFEYPNCSSNLMVLLGPLNIVRGVYFQHKSIHFSCLAKFQNGIRHVYFDQFFLRRKPRTLHYERLDHFVLSSPLILATLEFFFFEEKFMESMNSSISSQNVNPTSPLSKFLSSFDSLASEFLF